LELAAFEAYRPAQTDVPARVVIELDEGVVHFYRFIIVIEAGLGSVSAIAEGRASHVHEAYPACSDRGLFDWRRDRGGSYPQIYPDAIQVAKVQR